ncbi:DUF2817 domain-containing protein [Vibrio sp. DNB22_10_4]
MFAATPRELGHIHEYAERYSELSLSTLTHIEHQGFEMPIQQLSLGSSHPTAPCLILTGSIHGVERIGSQIILAFIRSLLKRRQWDSQLNDTLNKIRILTVPVVNPWGVALKTRSNHRGVDLMRNAPINASNPRYQLYAGQSISPKLPWYRGNSAKMEQELIAVSSSILKTTQSASSTIVLDLHSGFGTRDRLWFPFAHHNRPPETLHQFYLIYSQFRKSFPHYELYQFEPQWHQYTTHGDFWDWMYLRHYQQSTSPFVPLTLELGSWLWVKKNPMQLLSFSQLFHPTKPHRIKRVQRRHSTLLSYLMQVLYNELLTQVNDNDRLMLTKKAKKLWYPSY